ncbi:SIS domain-containing protein [Tritonibacter horizontis]|uniref:Glutamine--fructose-6-phosphate aminotransferase n=1 Tax=Tritonibacter horizontis TaxID=1768241 RepID=A0A132BUR9_9RHOB|nr:SIS domain-containing protein [Tritonibacter horizontis]KUP91577.1 glutamine--fructose-6-phosphate aminotransferase [Tritonibacter horizontis]
MTHQTLMAAEIAEIPAMLRRQLAEIGLYLEAGARLRADGTRGLITCARGTSDHAATYFKYLMEVVAGLPVASVGPSVASVYGADLQLADYACVAFSQSGGSPDLAALQAGAARGGAQSIAIVNVEDSPLGRGAALVLPVHAGPERAVAATKSYVGMLFASLALLTGYTGDARLRAALEALPELADNALRQDWSRAALPLARASSLFCLGRGPGLGVAAEAALKLKETCRIHAEAYSAAESLHGPVAIADAGFGALIFGTRDQAAPSLLAAETRLRSTGADVFVVQPAVGGAKGLPVPQGPHPLVDPILQAIAFYRFVEQLAVDLGENPDAPPGLQKVTETV